MNEHKSDIFTSTGSHRAWVGERPVREQRDQLGVAAATRPVAPNATSRSWINRTQPGQPANPRHAAITKNLAHFTNYKSWADKVKTNWKKEKEE